MTEKRLNVLFLCKTNTTLSIFGEVITNRMGRGKFQGFSAGSDPEPKLDEMTIYQLEHNNYDPNGLRVENWNEYAGDDAPVMDFIIILSDDVPVESMPQWPGDPMVTRWRIADPILNQGEEFVRKSAFVRALTELESRISIFVNLPLDSLDKLKLQRSLDAIGNKRLVN